MAAEAIFERLVDFDVAYFGGRYSCNESSTNEVPPTTIVDRSRGISLSASPSTDATC